MNVVLRLLLAAAAGLILRPVDSFPVTPTTWVAAETYDGEANVWVNQGSGPDLTDVVTEGTVEAVLGSGNGALTSVLSLVGNSSSVMSLGAVRPPSYTVCSITRYAGDTRGRIIQGGRHSWLHGHHKNVTGVAHYVVWYTQSTVSEVVPETDWLLMCGKNPADPPSNVVVNGRQVGIASLGGAIPADELWINGGYVATDRSDFAVAEIIIWSQPLSDADMDFAMAYLRSRLGLGLIPTTTTLGPTTTTLIPTTTTLIVTTTTSTTQQLPSLVLNISIQGLRYAALQEDAMLAENVTRAVEAACLQASGATSQDPGVVLLVTLFPGSVVAMVRVFTTTTAQDEAGVVNSVYAGVTGDAFAEVLLSALNGASVEAASTGPISLTGVAATFGSENIRCSLLEGNPPESARNYSSVFGGEVIGMGDAQSTLGSSQAWTAGISRAGEWMEMDLGGAIEVDGIVAQGPAMANDSQVVNHVSSFEVLTSLDGESWLQLQGSFYCGAFDSRTWNVLDEPVVVRYIRLVPQSWVGNISMRAGVLVCQPLPTTTTTITEMPSTTTTTTTSRIFGAGCADGTEEAVFVNGSIVGCDANWSSGGIDGGEAACGEFFRVCTSLQELELLGLSAGLCNGSVGDPTVFYATRVAGTGTGSCEPQGNNDLWGCGGGGRPAPCGVLTEVIGDSDAAGFTNMTANPLEEARFVLKSSGPGGVMCCFHEPPVHVAEEDGKPVVLLVILGVAAACVLMACCTWCCCLWRRPRKGRRTIIMQRPATRETVATSVKEKIQANYEVKEGSLDGKVHVVWEFPEKDVQKAFQRLAHEASIHLEYNDDHDKEDAESHSSPSLAQEEKEHWMPSKNSVAIAGTAYENGQEAQYFSARNMKWLRCTVDVKEVPDPVERLRYDVRVGSQVFEKVPLNCLRQPLVASGLVEYLLHGTWVPAQITTSPHVLSYFLFCYTVKVDPGDHPSAGRTFERVAPESLRHRFPAGSRVRVFRPHGRTICWQEGVVHASAGTGCNLAPSEDPAVVQIQDLATFGARTTRTHSDEIPAHLQRLWSTLPVTISEVHTSSAHHVHPGRREPELVPSYLLANSGVADDWRARRLLL